MSTKGSLGAIEAKIGTSVLDVSKLLALINELNDNYQDERTYATHALLRAILDHVPPILGQPSFTAVVNNYPWTRTDVGTLRLTARFRPIDACPSELRP